MRTIQARALGISVMADSYSERRIHGTYRPACSDRAVQATSRNCIQISKDHQIDHAFQV